MHRLHDAACYFRGRAAADALAVEAPPGAAPAPLLTGVEHVAALRRPDDGRARLDLAAVQRALAAAGCGRTDRLRFLAGYRQSFPGEAAASAPTRWPGYRTADFPGPQGDRPMSASPPVAAAAPAAAPRPAAESLWTRLRRGVRSLRQRPDWARFAGPDWADRIMDAAVTDRFNAKQGRSTGRWVLQAAGPGARRLTVYLKRHYRLPWWEGLLAALWPRRRLVARLSGVGTSGMGAARRRAGARGRGRRRVRRAVGPAAQLPRRRRAGRHAPPQRGGAAGRRPAHAGRISPLEVRPDRGNGPPHAPAARPLPLPQGPLPLPLLHRPGPIRPSPPRPGAAGSS